jgi:aspartyl-tRNA(Asn)/glutamyl-tRNA(Gln) amidotransferase subunit B
MELPIVEKGQLDIELDDGTIKTIGVTRAHLEEDAGKSLHEDFHGMTGVDLNRAGTPLLEIVSEPDMRSAKEAVAYMKKIHSLVTYLEICDGNMQEGSFRCDANVSVRPEGQEAYGTRAELKNINSFRFVERAINIEIERQIDIIESGGVVVQETRLYDADKNETRSMRSKEEANDYRYFPDPDLLPVELSEEFLQQVKQTLPELPHEKKKRFIEQYALKQEDAAALTSTRAQGDYYEALVNACGDARLAANWVNGSLAGMLNKENIDIANSCVSAEALGILLQRVSDNTISGKIAKEVFEAMWDGEGSADEVIEARGLKQITDTGEIEKIIDDIIAANPEQVEQFRAGKDKVLGFFVGQVMKVSGGKANPGQVNQLLKQKLQA